ncbi:MAG: LemA family protein [Burkholderiaceae bacterium]
MTAANGLIVFVALLAVPVIWGVVKFNEFVALRNRFQNAFSQIDVQLKRRHDLIPNLVSAVRAYMTHERETLEAVTNARRRAVDAQEIALRAPADIGALAAFEAAERALNGELGRMYALAEDYPQLRADESVSRLMEEIGSTENRIAFARQAFNDQVTSYNTGIESFPASLVAQLCGFRPAMRLQATRTRREREAIVVSL